MARQRKHAMSVTQVAQRLGTSRQAVYQKVDAGTLELTEAGIQAYEQWRQQGQTGHPPVCQNECRVKEFASRVGRPEATVYSWLARGKLTGHRHGTNWYLDRP